jgi:uncharacterized RDD family membrane protein YckC
MVGIVEGLAGGTFGQIYEHVPATLVAGITVAFCLVYLVFGEGGKRGQTLGKLIFGISVRDAKRGGPIGYGRALVRIVVFAVLWSLVVPGVIETLWPFRDSRNQT